MNISKLAIVLVAMLVALIACKGEQGDIGPRGPRGVQGLTGEPGRPGTPGMAGDTGTVGPAGPAGAVGQAGISPKLAIEFSDWYSIPYNGYGKDSVIAVFYGNVSISTEKQLYPYVTELVTNVSLTTNRFILVNKSSGEVLGSYYLYFRFINLKNEEVITNSILSQNTLYAEFSSIGWTALVYPNKSYSTFQAMAYFSEFSWRNMSIEKAKQLAKHLDAKVRLVFIPANLPPAGGRLRADGNYTYDELCQAYNIPR